MNDKAATLIGFAIKAGKIKYGSDLIEKSGRVRLIVCDETLAENSKKRMIKTGIPVIISKRPLVEITFRIGCKAIGITDGEMAKAILKLKENNYLLITEKND